MTKLEHFEQSGSAIRQSAWTERTTREACRVSMETVAASRRLLESLRASCSPRGAGAE